MDVNKKPGYGGFDEIYTANEPNVNGTTPIPKKTPYIVFSVLYQTEQDEEYVRDLKRISSLGLTNMIDNRYSLTITSDRKVIAAIDWFIKANEYQVVSNKALFKSLNQLKNECLSRLNNKTKLLPLKSKSITLFDKVYTHPIRSSLKEDTLLIKKKSSGAFYIFKKNTTGRSISEIEAFNGFCFRLLLGDRHPKVRGIHGNHQERQGVASKMLSQFETIYKCAARLDRAFTKDELLKSEIIKIWVAAYSEEDTDLHCGNYGFDHTGFCVKIDDDRATWALTSKFCDVNPETGDPDCDYTTPPITDFAITQRDIASFPFLQDANPYHWIDRRGSDDFFEQATIKELLNDVRFTNDKYFMFLKRILVPNTVYEAIGRATIASDSIGQKLVDHKVNKTKELKEILLNDPGFKHFMISNPHIIDTICNEFNSYNNDYKKPADRYLHVNVQQVIKQFNQIRYAVIRSAFLVATLKPRVQPQSTACPQRKLRT